MDLEQLRANFCAPPLPHIKSYYFSLDGGGRELVTEMLKEHSVDLMIEIGSFLCGSTLQWLESSPNLTVIGIDPWEEDMVEKLVNYDKLPVMQNCFSKIDDREAFIESVRVHGSYISALANVQKYRDRFIPLVGRSPKKLHDIKKMGVNPGLIYFDSDKNLDDLKVALELFPNAILAGDDWSWGKELGYPVQKAVKTFCKEHGFEYKIERATWVIDKCIGSSVSAKYPIEVQLDERPTGKMRRMNSITAKNQKAATAIEYFLGVDGMMGRLAANAFIFLLETQKDWAIKGPMFELGVYKGKSASLLCHYAAAREKVVLVDVGYQDVSKHLDDIHKSNIFVKSKSEDLMESLPKFKFYRGKVRVLHADGSHTFSNVVNDLTLAADLLAENGLVILDDFLNPHYPQVQAATYSYIARNPGVFSVFLIGDNKAVLSRTSSHRSYLNHCLENFQPRMEELEENLLISVTDRNDEFDALVFRPRLTDQAKKYAENLYEHFYRVRQ